MKYLRIVFLTLVITMVFGVVSKIYADTCYRTSCGADCHTERDEYGHEELVCSGYSCTTESYTCSGDTSDRVCHDIGGGCEECYYPSGHHSTVTVCSEDSDPPPAEPPPEDTVEDVVPENPVTDPPPASGSDSDGDGDDDGDSDDSDGCSCSGWVSGTCGDGTCASTQKLQTRSCNPGVCSSETRCIADSACTVTDQCTTPTFNNISSTCTDDPFTNGSLTASWTPEAGDASIYELDIFRSDNGDNVYNGEFEQAENYTCETGECTRTVSLPVGTYDIYVRSGGDCTPSAWRQTSNHEVGLCPIYELSGPGVYLDNTGEASCQTNAGGLVRCTCDTCTLVQPGDNARITISDNVFGEESVSTPVVGGLFNPFNLSIGNYTASLTNYDLEYTCTACTYGVIFDEDHGDDDTLAFFVTNQQDKWVQVGEGGDLHADSSAIPPEQITTPGLSIKVPFTCELDPTHECDPYPVVGGDTSSAGVASLVNGSVDFAAEEDVVGSVSPEDWLLRTQFQLPDQKYEFFKLNFEFPLNPVADDFNDQNNATKPTKPPANQAAYYHNDYLTINDDWDIESDESIVVFVDGDLNLNARTTVAQGGFLAFIVSGNIIVSPDLTSLNKNDPAMSGIYIANGEVRFETLGESQNDNFLVTNGTIAGWSGIAVERDFRSVSNNDSPVILFNFRPDLVLNAPKGFNVFQYFWAEVAP